MDYQPRLLTVRNKRFVPAIPFIKASDLLGDEDKQKHINACIGLLSNDLREQTSKCRGKLIKDIVSSQYQKLKQLFEWFEANEVHMAVFPEYSVFPENTVLLQQKADKVSSFAGLGIVRKANDKIKFDQNPLREVGFDDQQIKECEQKNTAVFFGPDGQKLLITKKKLAQGEENIFEEGEGPQIIRWCSRTNNVQPYTIRLSICLDSPAAAAESYDFELVCAFSRAATEFEKRNGQPCFVANHSIFGNTNVYAHDAHSTQNEAAATGKHIGLPSEAEGVFVYDFDREPQRPEKLTPTRNKVVFRSAIVYKRESEDLSGEEGSAEIVEAIDSWNSSSLQEPNVMLRIQAYSEFLVSKGGNKILLQAIGYIRNDPDALVNSPKSEFKLYTKHIYLKKILPPRIEYYYKLDALCRAAQQIVAADDSTEKAGELLDKCRSCRQAARASMTKEEDWLADIGSQQRIGTQNSQIGLQNDGSRVVMHFRLGTYAAEAAAKTLAEQHDCLRQLAKLKPSSVHLVYRAFTEKSTTDGLTAFLDAYLICYDDDSYQAAMHLAIKYSLAFRRAYNTSHEELELPPEGKPEFTVTKSIASGIRIRGSWAPVFDFMRRLDGPSSITVTVKPSGLPGVKISADNITRIIESDEIDKLGAQILSQCAEEQLGEAPGLYLSVSFSVEEVTNKDGFQEAADIVIDRFCGASVGKEGKEPDSLLPAEALRIARTSYGGAESRGVRQIKKRFAKPLDSPPSPTNGILLGQALARTSGPDRIVDIKLPDEARKRHMYVVGSTGSGKTNLLKNLAAQDVECEGQGVLVIDPHGDLVDFLLTRVGNRIDEVILLDFGNMDCLPILNPLDLDIDKNSVNKKTQQILAVEDFIDLLCRQSYHEWTGPRFKQIVRITLMAMIETDYSEELTPTLVEVMRILASSSRRKWLAEKTKGTDRYLEWQNTFGMKDTDLEEVINWVLSKFGEIANDGVLKRVFGGGESTVSLKKPAQENGIVLVVIPEWSMSNSTMSLLGAFILERVRKAIFSVARERGFHAKNGAYAMYVDEFQNFAATSFEQMLGEARKFGLGLTLANQNLQQLNAFSPHTGTEGRALREALLNNAQTIVTFGSGPSDNEILAKHLYVDDSDFKDIAPFAALAKISSTEITSAFTLKTDLAEYGVVNYKEAIIKRELEQTKALKCMEAIDKFLANQDDKLTKATEKYRSSGVKVRSMMPDYDNKEGAVYAFLEAERAKKLNRKTEQEPSVNGNDEAKDVAVETGEQEDTPYLSDQNNDSE
jgi:hypothetical protein